MLKIAVLALVVLFSAGPLAAQEETPVVEVFGGFAVARIDDNQAPRSGTSPTWDGTLPSMRISTGISDSWQISANTMGHINCLLLPPPI